MLRRALHAALAFAAVVGSAGPAGAQGVLALVRAGRWAEAQAAVAGAADPVEGKLVGFYRLLAPGAAAAAEIAAFIGQNPDWPQLPVLAARRDAALTAESDDTAALEICDRAEPAVALADALLRCAEAAARAGRPDAAPFAQRAWIAGPSDATWEARVAQRWAGAIGAAAQFQRFDRLAWTDTAGATRQFARLPPSDRPLAAARLALRRDDVAGPVLADALPAEQGGDSALMLERARFLRRANRDAEAVALWGTMGHDAERAAPADHRAEFWAERNLLARRRLRQGDAAGAYALADGHAQARPEQVSDAEFLAGFVALEKLGDPAAGARHFRALAAVSRASITQSRAHYWLGRALAGAARAAEYRLAAVYPSTFYGQRAAIELDGAAALAARIAAASAPPQEPVRGLDFAGRELTRAAATLVAWGEPRRAVPFLLRLQEAAPDATDTAFVGELATGFGLPDVAVALARRAGTAGGVPLATGWPLAVDIPASAAVEPALALAIIRQESSFDPGAVSPAGARGLMQLMPATAADTARRLAMQITPAALTADPAANVRLGTAYLRTLMDQYGAVPLAVAAYNAGARRVSEWTADAGDPRQPGVDPIDWIELIPFNETRNYVQRVIENQVVYRARLGAAGPDPLARPAG